MTVEEMLERMSSAEFVEWMAFYQSQPFGEERADLRAGVVAAMIGNVNRTRNARSFKPSDFLLYQQPETALDVAERLRQTLIENQGKNFKASAD